MTVVTDAMVDAFKHALLDLGVREYPDDRAMRAALEAALGAMLRPIEEAPRDFTDILVCFQGQFSWVYFIAKSNGSDTRAHGYARPTHFAPLLPPPEGK